MWADACEADTLYGMQVFLDIVEEVNVLLNSRGEVLSSHVVGRLVMKALLTGMPDIKIGLNDKVEVRDRRRIAVPRCRYWQWIARFHKGNAHDGMCRVTFEPILCHAGCEVSSVGQPGPVQHREGAPQMLHQQGHHSTSWPTPACVHEGALAEGQTTPINLWVRRSCRLCRPMGSSSS